MLSQDHLLSVIIGRTLGTWHIQSHTQCYHRTTYCLLLLGGLLEHDTFNLIHNAITGPLTVCHWEDSWNMTHSISYTMLSQDHLLSVIERTLGTWHIQYHTQCYHRTTYCLLLLGGLLEHDTFNIIHNAITGPLTVCYYWEDSWNMTHSISYTMLSQDHLLSVIERTLGTWHIQSHTQCYHRTTYCLLLLGGLLEHGTFNLIHNAITGPLTVCYYWEDSWNMTHSISYTMLSQDHLLSVIIGRTLGTWHIQSHTQCYHRTTYCLLLLGGLLEHDTFNLIHNAITGPLTVCYYWEDSWNMAHSISYTMLSQDHLLSVIIGRTLGTWHIQSHTQCYHRTTYCLLLLGGLLEHGTFNLIHNAITGPLTVC